MTSTLRPFLSVTPAFRDGSDSPRAFLERCLETVGAREGDVKAFVVIDKAGARRAADASTARWRAGAPLSAVDGMPVGVKDIMETLHMPTGNGSPLFEGWQSGRDSAAVIALREAGAVILGKTVTTEFAATVPGPTRNPFDLARTPGGSSSGSAAAVGCGMVPAALGTQVVGSTIRPAGYCGAYGFKPTPGAINRGGSLDYLSQSSTGTIAASLADAWQMAREISARVGGDPGFVGLRGPMSLPPAKPPRRLAVLETSGWARAAPEAKQSLARALETLADAGIEIVRGAAANLPTMEAAVADAFGKTNTINTWEWRWPINTFHERDAGKLSDVMVQRHMNAQKMTQDDYAAAIAERERARALHAALSESCDALVTLSAPDCAPQGLASTGDPAFAVPASYLGAPAVTLPVLACGGLPLGLQLIGYRDAEAALFSTAAAVLGVVAPSAAQDAAGH